MLNSLQRFSGFDEVCQAVNFLGKSALVQKDIRSVADPEAVFHTVGCSCVIQFTKWDNEIVRAPQPSTKVL